MATSSSDRVTGLNQVPNAAASACSRSSRSTGTTRGWNGSRTVCRRAIDAASAESSSVATIGPMTRTVARWSASSSGRSSTSLSQPAAASATTANSTAIPQLITCWRPVGSSTGSARPGSRNTSSWSAVAVNRHGWVLWIEGARVAASTTCAHCCWSTVLPPGRVPGTCLPHRRPDPARASLTCRRAPARPGPPPTGGAHPGGRAPHPSGRPRRRRRRAPAAPRRAGPSPAGSPAAARGRW